MILRSAFKMTCSSRTIRHQLARRPGAPVGGGVGHGDAARAACRTSPFPRRVDRILLHRFTPQADGKTLHGIEGIECRGIPEASSRGDPVACVRQTPCADQLRSGHGRRGLTMAQATRDPGREPHWRRVLGGGGVAVSQCGPSAGRGHHRAVVLFVAAEARSGRLNKHAFLPVHVVNEEIKEPATGGIEAVLASARCLLPWCRAASDMGTTRLSTSATFWSDFRTIPRTVWPSSFRTVGRRRNP